MNSKGITYGIIGFLVFCVYTAIVFVGEAILFGVYQFLRDRGYTFWESVTIVTAFFALLALPAISSRTKVIR